MKDAQLELLMVAGFMLLILSVYFILGGPN